jgi:hypothetical protein
MVAEGVRRRAGYTVAGICACVVIMWVLLEWWGLVLEAREVEGVGVVKERVEGLLRGLAGAASKVPGYVCARRVESAC